MIYTKDVDAGQLEGLVRKYTEIYNKQEELKEEKVDLDRYTKALGYNPILINRIVKRKNHPNIDKLYEEEALFLSYNEALNIK